VYRGLIPLW